MPETVQALVVLLIAVLTGALFVWGYEQRVRKWSVGSPDPLVRFLATSATIQIAFAPLTYWVWHRYVASGTWNDATWPPLGLWPAAALYLSIPFAVGVVAGRIAVTAHSDDAPRAWDAFFAEHLDGWLRIRMKSGHWVGGGLGAGTTASVYRESRDLVLPFVVEVDRTTGEIAEEPRILARSLYVNAEEIEFFEFIER